MWRRNKTKGDQCRSGSACFSFADGRRIGGWMLVCAVCLFAGCKSPSDPGGPNGPGEGTKISVQYLKSLYKNYPLPLVDDYVLQGQVVSSDRWGNFRYSLVVQDETGGIEIKIGMKDYFTRYMLGQTVSVRCAGLVLGSYGGALQLGVPSGDERYECGLIPAEQASQYISIGQDVGKIVPLALEAADLSMRYVGCLVRFSGVQVIREESGNAWGNPVEYTERHLEYCAGRDTVVVRTSPDAVFAGARMPSGNGDIEGVLGYFAGKYYLILNSDEFLLMDEERCRR